MVNSHAYMVIIGPRKRAADYFLNWHINYNVMNNDEKLPFDLLQDGIYGFIYISLPNILWAYEYLETETSLGCFSQEERVFPRS